MKKFENYAATPSNPNWNNIIEYLQEFEGAQKNIEYIIAKYPDNTELKEAFEKVLPQ